MVELEVDAAGALGTGINHMCTPHASMHACARPRFSGPRFADEKYMHAERLMMHCVLRRSQWGRHGRTWPLIERAARGGALQRQRPGARAPAAAGFDFAARERALRALPAAAGGGAGGAGAAGAAGAADGARGGEHLAAQPAHAGHALAGPGALQRPRQHPPAWADPLPAAGGAQAQC